MGLHCGVLGVWLSLHPLHPLLMGTATLEVSSQPEALIEHLLHASITPGAGMETEDRLGAACSQRGGPNPTCIRLNSGFGL